MNTVHIPSTPYVLPLRPRPPRRAARALAGLTVLGGWIGLAACGDDADAAELAPSVCEGMVGFGAATAAFPEDPAEIGPFITAQVLPGIDGFIGDLPEDLAADGQTLRDTMSTIAATGDPSGYEGSFTAQAALGAAVHEGCDLGTVDVVAEDYSFGGLPETMASGRASIKFVNDGTEEHEMVLLRRNDDVTDGLDELMAEGPDAIFGQSAFTGVVFSSPDETGYVALDLEPGTYFAVCMIPTGGDEKAAPHIAHGMHAELVVT